MSSDNDRSGVVDVANWVIEVNEKLRRMDWVTEREQYWKTKCIYKVPVSITDLNKKAYLPQMVSFGPYHHGEDHLRQMEDHKHRALLQFIHRSNKPLKAYVDKLGEVLQHLMDSYDWLDLKWLNDQNRFLQMMMLDGCFMLELLRYSVMITNDYPVNDPIFSHHGMVYVMPYIKRDMLMLQNQLPILLLETLLDVENHRDKRENEKFLHKTISKFCSPNTPLRNMDGCLHVLDVYRKNLIQEPHKKSHRRRTEKSSGDIICSAMRLHEAGIRIEKSKTMSLKDITFRDGVLYLPVIVVDDTTEFMFLNMMAFEKLHVGAGNDITSYIFFMDSIIDSAKDVSLLNSSGIIYNAIGSDKAVADLFNALARDVTLDPDSSLDKMHTEVKKYYMQKMRKWRRKLRDWRSNLYENYFSNPWTIISVAAAAFLLALTVIQTLYTVLSFYSSGDKNNNNNRM